MAVTLDWYLVGAEVRVTLDALMDHVADAVAAIRAAGGAAAAAAGGSMAPAPVLPDAAPAGSRVPSPSQASPSSPELARRSRPSHADPRQPRATRANPGRAGPAQAGPSPSTADQEHPSQSAGGPSRPRHVGASPRRPAPGQPKPAQPATVRGERGPALRDGWRVEAVVRVAVSVRRAERAAFARLMGALDKAVLKSKASAAAGWTQAEVERWDVLLRAGLGVPELAEPVVCGWSTGAASTEKRALQPLASIRPFTFP